MTRTQITRLIAFLLFSIIVTTVVTWTFVGQDGVIALGGFVLLIGFGWYQYILILGRDRFGRPVVTGPPPRPILVAIMTVVSACLLLSAVVFFFLDQGGKKFSFFDLVYGIEIFIAGFLFTVGCVVETGRWLKHLRLKIQGKADSEKTPPSPSH